MTQPTPDAAREAFKRLQMQLKFRSDSYYMKDQRDNVDVVREALAENAALREQLATAAQNEVKFAREADALEAQLATAREALERIGANEYGAQSLMENDASHLEFSIYYSDTLFAKQSIARKALATLKGAGHE